MANAGCPVLLSQLSTPLLECSGYPVALVTLDFHDIIAVTKLQGRQSEIFTSVAREVY